ncbi:tRNA lysidine(34) synthetase TilS [Limosilactobacillus sp. STM2_1]|uniref:tRNA(Ile)-lysidine synthase n=1 Tax=Limosilactobacillus rudii TaxID=2759755 RepID=A0A7W3ULA5_9LACO|nr:tRNA lysidine(34) synthetase TilS [Limosilactobacillus rudii]MBB1079615.1 tRNA lysidine(34) synthetase TilS [Limosilactobacillus rudii]MBB1097693.1 tRNA lysidine(34) synthetase TilS [Limosilactobacillus rudii]MCD7134802.1 tRNA lysidine(34) synthetase TilS [Limosilactobacillus rudii]
MLELQNKFERHLQRSRFFTSADKVVIAVSTGVDSMVLLDLLQQLPSGLRPQIIVAHMNHELRSQSWEEEEFIRQYCQQHHLELAIAHWPQKLHPPRGIENAARQARYHFFAQTMKNYGAHILITAHHQNDLAETMLMKMVRGGQISQLIGIQDQRKFAGGMLVRPLLPFSKDILRQYAMKRQLKWYEDKTNHDLSIQRNRFRHEIIPQLEKENPQLLAHLESYHYQLAALLAWQQQEISTQLAQVIDDHDNLLIDKLVVKSYYMQKLLLQRWLNVRQVYDVKTNQVEELLALMKNQKTPQQEVLLPHQFIFEKKYSVGIIKKANNHFEDLQKPQAHVIELEQWYQVDEKNAIAISFNRKFFNDDSTVMPIWISPRQFPLRLRGWKKEDRLRLRGGHHQKVKRVLIDQKVSADQRQQQTVLVDAQDTVIWLVKRKWSWLDRPDDYQEKWRLCFIGIKIRRKTDE